MHDDLRRAIEEIKLRAPIEDVVRERVPELRRAGALWVACCPFHEERTPSFKVDPRRGTWYCFGACSRGGDQISFVESFDRVPFLEALEILAARTGVTLPSRKPQDAREEGERQRLLSALGEAERFFRAALASPEGKPARDYLARRGLAREACEDFGLGWAPAGGQALVTRARGAGHALPDLIAAGLARQSEEGRPYDFFRGRLTIPIRDERGRTVGFGARLLEGEGPKYVNTPETPLFHKGRLVYGLDRALEAVRKSGELVLVEGYTDVIAAHQVGRRNVAAVLGTATTEAHASLVRRTGARRVLLVFDGDEAGRQACFKALHGLLPLSVELAVVRLPGGIDPADLVVRDGGEALGAALELAREWFDFALDGLEGLEPRALGAESERLIALLERVARPVERDLLLKRLAERVELPFESLLEQRRGARKREAPRAAPAVPPRAQPGAPALSARELSAWRDAVGAVLADPTLVPRARSLGERCPDPALVEVLRAAIETYEDESATPGVAAVLDRLADRPEHALVMTLFVRGSAGESPRTLLEGAIRCLDEARARREYVELKGEYDRLEAAGEADSEQALALLQRLHQLPRQASVQSPTVVRIP